MLVTKALKSSPFTLRDIANESGLAYTTVQAYAYGRRQPGAENRRRLAFALLKLAERAVQFAEQLHHSAEHE